LIGLQNIIRNPAKGIDEGRAEVASLDVIDVLHGKFFSRSGRFE
jgi:hypothetical protein